MYKSRTHPVKNGHIFHNKKTSTDFQGILEIDFPSIPSQLGSNCLVQTFSHESRIKNYLIELRGIRDASDQVEDSVCIHTVQLMHWISLASDRIRQFR